MIDAGDGGRIVEASTIFSVTAGVAAVAEVRSVRWACCWIVMPSWGSWAAEWPPLVPGRGE